MFNMKLKWRKGMDNIVIEKLEYEELEEYKELIEDSFGHSQDIEIYKQMYSTNRNYEIIVGKIGDKIVGSVTILKIDLFTFSFQPMIELFNVCVKSKYRESKIGTLMLNYVISFAKKNNYKSITLTCLDDLPIVHKFYENVGFKKANSRKYVMDLENK